MKRSLSLRASAASIALGLLVASAIPAITLAQSAMNAQSDANAPEYKPTTSTNDTYSAVMITALNNAGYSAKLIHEAGQPPIIDVGKDGINFTVNFENCMMSLEICTHARFIQKFAGDFSSVKTLAWNKAEESDAKPDDEGAGNLSLEFGIYDPKISTEYFDRYLGNWLQTLNKFEEHIGGRPAVQPSKIAMAEPVVVAQTAAGAAPQPEQASDGELLSDAELAGITRAIEFPGAYAKYKLKDYPEAVARFQRMAANPDHDNAAESQFYLGEMAEWGRGVAKDEAEAIRYYKLAAAGGESDGHYALGKIYSNNRNFADAAAEFRKFVVKQDGYVGDKAEARYKLGKFYASGQGVPQDFALAAEQYALAIDLIGRHNDAHYELGKLYLEGKGVGQDYAKAAENFQIAAVDYEYRDQPGVVDAQYALGSLYGAGRGVAQSDAEAIKYLRMAARQDHIEAQFGLGMMFAAGKGVPQSISTAYLWIARAAEGDVSTRGLSEISKAAIAGQNGTAKAISARDSIRGRMNAEQIADAQILVDRCIASRYACNWGD